MDQKQQRKAAIEFAKDWEGRGYEKGDTQVFWYDLLRTVVGVEQARSKLKFEKKTSTGGFADCYIPDCKTLVEQKALGVSLDKPEPRRGLMVTPFQQAREYAASFPWSQQPRFIIVCNFATFRIHDLDKSDPESDYVEFPLSELPEHFHQFDFMVDPAHSRSALEKQVSMQAGELIGKLHAELLNCYIDPDSRESQHSLNVLCVRLVFCLYCEDADLFEKDALLNYLRTKSAEDMRSALKRLFRTLNTPFSERDPYDEDVNGFPYVNGGLFKEEVEIPNFTNDLRYILLFECSQQTDWSKISPTIFGGIFESTLNPVTRRQGGMHYTSPENIHKVIDPLFLNDLRDEFDSIVHNRELTPKSRKNKLRTFRKKIGSLRFFDPACGSGNFLTETYLCLRALEDDVLSELNDGQMAISFDEGLNNDERVSLDQFYGIEINDFAVSVAKTALWIAQLQADRMSEILFDLDIDRFPLGDTANIVEGNALRMDWNDLIPAASCDFIMGNPPFYGARFQSKEQKAEILDVFHGAKNCGNVDYVAGWYMKAAEYVDDRATRCAFVSTNSICQGEQVANVWKPLWDLGVRIDFAHNTFRWVNEASGQAHVFVIIVGFSKLGGPKRLFHHDGPDVDAVEVAVDNINAYLSDAPDVFVWNRSKPICDVPGIGIGNKPIDGGFYIFKDDERDEFLSKEPGAARFMHPYIGSQEFINGHPRNILYLGKATDNELDSLPLCRERIESVRMFRLSSSSAPTIKLADRPKNYHVENMPEGTSVLVPKVSSERRNYIPMGFIEPETLCSDLVFLIPNASLYHYGVLQSQVHNAWMRTVCGRLESRYRYSGGIVYNNFVWPELTDEQRGDVEGCARGVLDAREAHPGKTLADLYDPDKMPYDLLAAHKALDAAVERAYGVDFQGDEEKIVAHLFKLYAEKTAGE